MLLRTLLSIERVFRERVAAIEAAGVKQVLLLEYQVPLGCCVHLTPVYEALKRCRPEITVSVATRGLGVELLRHSPYVDHVIETPTPTVDLKAAVLSLRAQLKAWKIEPDCVLTGASDQRTRIALLALLGAGGWRGGFNLKGAMLYQRPLEYDPGLSLIDNNLRLAGLAGCEANGVEPRVFFSPRNAETARTLLAEANPRGRPLVVMVMQGSGGQATGWHTDRFSQVIRHASETLGCAVVYVGTAGDATGIEEIRRSSGGAGISIAGRTSVTELAAVLAMSDAMVTLDTGTMHVGRAMKTPMVVLGPSWQKPLEWLPLKVANVRVLRGMDRDTVPEGYQLDEISAESVIGALNDLLGVYAPSVEARKRRVEQSISSIDHVAAMSEAR